MLTTDAYAFIDIDNPFCAWAAYRGVLVSAQDQPGFVSVWLAGRLRDPAQLRFELDIEAVRISQFPNRISRLRGMFCLPDIESAERALFWDTGFKTHFQRKFLAELSFCEAGIRRDLLDANWITFAPLDDSGYLIETCWIQKYWRGEPYPNKEPVWETLVDGRLVVLGTELRQRAYEAIKSEFPNSLMFLELSRQAANVNSDLGAISAFLHHEGEDCVLKYVMDMVDADDPEFIKKLVAQRESGHPINYADMKPHIDQDSFGCVPDFRPYHFRIPVY